MAANNKLIILVLLVCMLPHIIFTSTSAKDVDTKAYVDSWCKTTKYQNLCVQSLTPFLRSRALKSPEELVLFVLKESINVVRNALENQEIPMSPQENALYKICQNALSSIVKDLREIIMILSRGGEGGVGKKYRNDLRGWTNTARTHVEVLVNTFQDRTLDKLGDTMKEIVKNVEEIISNAAAITEHYAAK